MASKNEQETPATDEAQAGAWAKDKEIGNILGQTFDSGPIGGEGTTFLILGARAGETIKTKFGDNETIRMLVRKIGTDGAPTGPAFECSTVESAIVAKLQNATPDDFPAIVRYHAVESKQNPGKPAHVLTFVGVPGESASADLLEAYGVAGDTVSDEFGGMGVREPVAGEVG